MAGVAALAVGTLGFASTAGAAGTAQRLPAKPLVTNAAGATNYAAGYAVQPSAGLAGASVTFTVPTISCTATDDSDGAWQADGVYTIKGSSLDTLALVQTFCNSSGPKYQYLLQTSAGTIVEPGAAPGDTVVASIFQTGSATWAKIHDLTQNLYWFADTSNQDDTLVVLGALNATFEGVPVPTYTKVHFSNATVNSDYLGFESPSAYNTLNGGDLVVKAGALKTTGTGSTFSTTFKHAS
jgi:hypothetical protein